MGEQGPPVVKKKDFLTKVIVDHMELQNKCFWRVLSLWCAVLALLESQNALNTGCFETKNGSKNGSKMCFSKQDYTKIWAARTNETSPF